MNLPRLSGSQACVVATALFLALGFLGCSKKNTVVLDNSVFNSAPPELRETWKAAADYISKDNYLGAATNLMVLLTKGQQLSPAQNEALNQAWTKLGNQAFEAANKGDKGATDAVLRMKEAGVDDRRGQR